MTNESGILINNDWVKQRSEKFMRIKNGDYIEEVNVVKIRSEDIVIGICFYQTKEHTQEIGKQLLEKGYADLTEFECR